MTFPGKEPSCSQCLVLPAHWATSQEGQLQVSDQHVINARGPLYAEVTAIGRSVEVLPSAGTSLSPRSRLAPGVTSGKALARVIVLVVPS